MKKQARQVFLLTTTTDTQRTTEINSDQQASANNQAPRTVTIGGIAYEVSQVPELQDLVNAHRKDAAQAEKAKLYPQVEAIKRSFMELERSTPTVPGNASQGQPGSNQLTPEVEQYLNGMFAELRKDIQPLIDSQKANSAAQIELYRNQLIQANKDSVIAEMVVGTTKEELDNSLVEAKRVFANYKDVFGHRTQEQQIADNKQSAQQGQAQQQPNTVATQPNQGVPTQQFTATQQTQNTIPTQVETAQVPTQVSSERTIVLPTAPGSFTSPSEGFTDVSNMSMEEYGKRRAELQSQLKVFEQ